RRGMGHRARRWAASVWIRASLPHAFGVVLMRRRAPTLPSPATLRFAGEGTRTLDRAVSPAESCSSPTATRRNKNSNIHIRLSLPFQPLRPLRTLRESLRSNTSLYSGEHADSCPVL